MSEALLPQSVIQLIFIKQGKNTLRVSVNKVPQKIYLGT